METQPLEFWQALKRSLGVAIVGAIVPFSVSFAVAKRFGLSWVEATHGAAAARGADRGRGHVRARRAGLHPGLAGVDDEFAA